MKVKELQALDAAGLKGKLRDLNQEAFNLRFQHRTSQLENTARIRQVRRDIARVLTVINEKSQAGEG
ncbi:MAG: 50S ribosomal protein L29 [Magnetococcus sp. WYHC-3]